MSAKPNRAERIASHLRAHAAASFTVADLVTALGEPADHAKFFSSTLLRMFERGDVTRSKPDGKLFRFQWAGGPAADAGDAGADRAAGGARKKRARKSRAKGAAGDDTSWTRTKTGPTEEERRQADEARRRAEEEHARRRRPSWFTADPLRVFKTLTGFNGNDRDAAAMKSAYKKASLALHPDTNGHGDDEKFKGLSAAWTAIKKSRGWK